MDCDPLVLEFSTDVSLLFPENAPKVQGLIGLWDTLREIE